MSLQSRLSGDVVLGNGYYLFENGPFTSIVYDSSPKYQNKGLPVIPFEVVKQEANSNYIFAITLNDNNTVKSYWIIDKNIKIDLDDCSDQKSCDSLLQLNVSGPMDSINFYNTIAKKNITLKRFEK